MEKLVVGKSAIWSVFRNVQALRPSTGLAAVCSVLALAGCWEEIHYKPPETIDVGSSPEARDEAPANDPEPQAVTASATSQTGATASPDAPTPDTSPSSVRGDALFAPAYSAETTPVTPEPSPEGALTADDPVLPTSPETADRIGALGPAAPRESPAEPAFSGDSQSPAAPPATAHQRALVWQAASRWSFAAALLAKDIAPERYEPIRAEAVDAARELGIDLPALPVDAGADRRETAVIELLGAEGAKPLIESIGTRVGESGAALAQFAIRSQLLLLTYSPTLGDLGERATALRQSAEQAQLAGDLWMPLVTLVEANAEFVQVKAAVFEVHRKAGLRLKEAEGEAATSVEAVTP